MRTSLKLLLSAVVAAAVCSTVSAATLAAPLVRTVYVTVTDGKGPVKDLTAADFKVKEGGKDREIVKAEPATARMHLMVMVEERLAPDASVRQGMFDFLKRVQPLAETTLITVGLRNTVVVDNTTSMDALIGGLNQISLNPQPTSNLLECVLEIAKKLEQQKPTRPVILVIGFSGGQSSGATANEVLNQLRQSGSMVYSVTLAAFEGGGSAPLGALGDESAREQVLGDGPKQTGGRRVDAVSTSAVPKSLQQVADDMAAQYVITYALPEGVKPDKRFNVTVTRKGVTVRAPNGLPDR